MKIAVPVRQNGQIDEHFGHCEFYGIYNINEKGEIESAQTLPAVDGCGCKSNIASVLAGQGVTVMLAGGIGGGAINVLNQAGIEVIRGCSGNASEAVKLFAEGKVSDSGESCTQHEHHHGHNH
jgi:predicted Fe-Mo cluster-binding NifX family protein